MVIQCNISLLLWLYSALHHRSDSFACTVSCVTLLLPQTASSCNTASSATHSFYTVVYDLLLFCVGVRTRAAQPVLDATGQPDHY
jgi:hypothetical protein